ncbi:MAG: hypothetical protein RLZZ488_1457 [Pseudomonadota bacterium]|jgi:hypothetical protein
MARFSVFFLMIVGGFFFFYPKSAAASESDGLKTFVAIDVVGEAFRRDKQPKVQEALIRGAELHLSAAIDPLFDGTLGIAAHPEDGVSIFELHEALISSSKLIPLTDVRLGQGFLAIGKLNRTHQHDWPFISVPLVHSTFFDSEGINDLLIDSTFNVPVGIPLSLTLGLAKGWNYGHAHSEGQRPKVPTHYARAQFFTEMPMNGGLQVGFNYLGRTDHDSESMRLLGLDFTTKWREGRTLVFFTQGEFWFRRLAPRNSAVENSLGFYLFPQTHLGYSTDLGVRFDSFTVLSLKDVSGTPLTNYRSAVIPTLTFRPSEFSTFRVAYGWDFATDQPNGTNVVNSKADVQVTYILGAHPAHEF